MLILEIRLFWFLFLFFFSFSFFYFFNVKYGITPLYVAAQKGDEQIVQNLLEKGKANVALGDQVIVLFIYHFFVFQVPSGGGVGGYCVIFVLCFIF